MQFHMSSASVPNPVGGALPQGAPSRPEIVKPAPPKPRPRGLWWGLAALAITAGVGLYLNRDRMPTKQGGGSSSGVMRTAMISVGDIHRTLRITGSVSAERFAAIIAPQLRGNRGSYGGNRMSSRGGGYGGRAGGRASRASGSSSSPLSG